MLVAASSARCRPAPVDKNVLVFAAPVAAGVIDERDVLRRHHRSPSSRSALAASGTYLLNDASDVEADRQHPTKRNRPDRRRHRARSAWPSRSAVVLIVVALARRLR